jgi:Universal stress protein family
MTSAPVRDPLSDHLITPQNSALLLIDYQPSQLAGASQRAGEDSGGQRARHHRGGRRRVGQLLVVGSRGYGGFADAVLGSVSTYCVHHAHCPVVVIRPRK